MSRITECVLSGLLLGLVAIQSLQAKTIVPGEQQDAAGHEVEVTTLALRPELAGDTIASLTMTFTLYYSGDDDPPRYMDTGLITQWVVRRYDTGTLDFYYMSPSYYIEQMIISSFAGFDTDFGLRVDLGAKARAWQGASAGVWRSAGDGAYMDFGNGQDSIDNCVFFIGTNATVYDIGGTLDLRGVQWHGTVAAFQPCTVPLPSAVWAGVAMLCLNIVARLFRFPGRS